MKYLKHFRYAQTIFYIQYSTIQLRINKINIKELK